VQQRNHYAAIPFDEKQERENFTFVCLQKWQATHNQIHKDGYASLLWAVC